MSASDTRPAGEYVVELGPGERSAGAASNETLVKAFGALSRHGFAQLNNVFPPGFIEGLRRDYAARYLSRGEEAMRESSLRVGHRRLMITVEVSGVFNDPFLYANPFCFPVIDALLGGRAVLQSVGSVCAFPGSDAQHVHVDHPHLFDEPGVTESLPCYALTWVIPLGDLDPDVGTTAVWLGTHRELPKASPDEFRYEEAYLPETKAGSVYLMDYRLVHGGTANRSGRPRPILYLVYARPWFTDFANFSSQPKIVIPAAELSRIPGELRRLFVHATTV
jgi:hypothetical protein